MNPADALDRPMLVLSSRLLVRPGTESAVAKAVLALVGPSRSEPGCVAYFAHRSLDNPRVFMFYEQWADERAYEAHRQTPHFEQLVGSVIGPSTDERQREQYALMP